MEVVRFLIFVLLLQLLIFCYSSNFSFFVKYILYTKDEEKKTTYLIRKLFCGSILSVKRKKNITENQFQWAKPHFEKTLPATHPPHHTIIFLIHSNVWKF